MLLHSGGSVTFKVIAVSAFEWNTVDNFVYIHRRNAYCASKNIVLKSNPL